MCAVSRPFHVARVFASDICLASEQQCHCAVCVLIAFFFLLLLLFSSSFFSPHFSFFLWHQQNLFRGPSQEAGLPHLKGPGPFVNGGVHAPQMGDSTLLGNPAGTAGKGQRGAPLVRQLLVETHSQANLIRPGTAVPGRRGCGWRAVGLVQPLSVC